MSFIRDPHPDITFLRTHNLMDDHMIAWVHNFHFSSNAQSNYTFFFRNLLKGRRSFIRQTATEEITKKNYRKSIELELNVMHLCKQELIVRVRTKITKWYRKMIISILIDFFSVERIWTICDVQTSTFQYSYLYIQSNRLLILHYVSKIFIQSWVIDRIHGISNKICK